MARELRAPPTAVTTLGLAPERQGLIERYQQVRQSTETLCKPLAIEDYVIQSMPDCSPTKWHLAHVSWFFETFLLKPFASDYQSPDPDYAYLFNSYYNAVGDKYPRPQRGLISRPTVDDVYRYRKHVDEYALDLLECVDAADLPKIMPIVTLGLQHEQQHQELIVTDLKHMLSHNPLHPVYTDRLSNPAVEVAPLQWYLEFIRDGGYGRAEYWLSMGWATVQQERWRAPLYWEEHDGGWLQYTLSGLRPVDLAEPVTHVSYFEADAYARWAGARLPTEAEWEMVAATVPTQGNFVESGRFHPAPMHVSAGSPAPAQLFGDVWEWTQSSSSPYPGFRIAPGALGEYNGKFMCNQYVLRGGSCATPESHIRPTYRNFFPPEARWQFSGVRLAQDA